MEAIKVFKVAVFSDFWCTFDHEAVCEVCVYSPANSQCTNCADISRRYSQQLTCVWKCACVCLTAQLLTELGLHQKLQLFVIFLQSSPSSSRLCVLMTSHDKRQPFAHVETFSTCADASLRQLAPSWANLKHRTQGLDFVRERPPVPDFVKTPDVDHTSKCSASAAFSQNGNV